MLTLEQTVMHFNDGKKSIMLRIILPSKSEGGWTGNKQTIREWTVTHENFYKPCTDAEVRKYETELGEVDPNTIQFAQHLTLGRVAVTDTN